MQPLFSLIVAGALIIAIGCGNNNRRTPKADTRVMSSGIAPYTTTTQTAATPAAQTGSTPTSPSAAVNPVAAVYTCPMHPDAMQNTPGKCPQCGMELVLKK